MPTITAEEQLMLELINEARLDPITNATRYIYSYKPLMSLQADVSNALKAFNVDGNLLRDQFLKLTPVGALAWNDSLATAAEKHSAAMIAADEQSHQVAGEPGLAARAQAEGYSGFRTLGENVFAYSSSLLYGHAGFMVDWGEGVGGMQTPAGHRNNIMSANFTEVGIDVTTEKNAATEVGPYLITQDFGSRGKFYVTGVAYTDNDLNNFYSIGEGVAGLTATWGSASTSSGATGGYSLALPTLGAGVLTLSGGGLSGPLTVTTSVTDSNLKLDVVDGRTLLTSGSISVSGPVSKIQVISIQDVTVTAGAGNQQLVGNDGIDTLDGGAGDDYLFGGFNNDKLYGGDGNDQLKGEGGNDFIDGGDGTDTAVYHDPRSKFIVMANRDGSTTVSGDRDGTDKVINVEYFRFADGLYKWDTGKTVLMLVQNSAPTLSSTQAIATSVGIAKQFTVTANDVDGDPLTYATGRAANGVVQALGGGVFSYTPKTGYIGSDSFSVTASDGRGGTATQTINVTVSKANEAPTVAASQSVSTSQSQAKQITVTGSDADGDKLTYTATNASHGTVTGGTNGVFTYTPTKGYSGGDSFAVNISDGRGGTATQTVNLQVAFVLPPSSGTGASDKPFLLYMANGLVDAVGGTGSIQGTNGFQDITLLDMNDHITFDGTFNRGGDIIRLPGNANEYAIIRIGATVEFRTADGSYTIPLGEAGTSIVFADGVRKLVHDGVTNQSLIGSQVITTSAAQIVAPTDHSPLPTGASNSASGLIHLSIGAEIAVGGNHSLAGTSGAEKVHYLGGNLLLDGSFNQGGDTLYLSDPISSFSAYRSGSTLILMSSGGKVVIPIGEVGMALDFDGDVHVLRYDAIAKKVMIGDQVVTSVSESNPDELFQGDVLSLDVGAPGNSVTINLDADIDFTLTDHANVTSNVVLHGFDMGDLIEVTGVPASEYNFINGDADKDGIYGDLIITYNTNTAKNTIAIIDAFDPNASVFGLNSAEAAMGGQFITFG